MSRRQAASADEPPAGGFRGAYRGSIEASKLHCTPYKSLTAAISRGRIEAMELARINGTWRLDDRPIADGTRLRVRWPDGSDEIVPIEIADDGRSLMALVRYHGVELEIDLDGGDYELSWPRGAGADEDTPPRRSIEHWYISAAAVRQFQQILGVPQDSDGHFFDGVAAQLDRICQGARFWKPIGRYEKWAAKCVIRGKTQRLELNVSREKRPEGDAPQLVGVKLRGHRP